MNRTDMLVEAIKVIAENHKEDLKKLSFIGVKGGQNARDIKGWAHSPNGTISKASKIAKIPTMNYWEGSLPTPSTAIPECIENEIYSEYKKIFNK